MKTKKAELTKKSILKAAGELFSEKSVKKVTINEIVKRAGVAKGTFYLYYESKDDVVWDYIEYEFQGANKWILSIENLGFSAEAIKEIVARIIQYVKDNIVVLRIMHNARFSSFFGTKQMEERYFGRWVKPIHAWLEKGKKAGAFEVDDPQFMAYFMLYGIHEMFDRILLEEVPFDLDDLKDNLEVLLVKTLCPRD